MMKRAFGLVAVLAFASSIVLMPALALAHEGENHATEAEARQHEAQSLRKEAKNQLSDAQKRDCEARAANITAVMVRSVTRAENYGTFLATIAGRVQAFAQNHPLDADKDGRPSQYYQEFISKIAAAQTQFDSDLAALKAAGVFSCDSNEPKTQIAAFQAAHTTIIKDLKDWRVTVGDLVAVLKANSKGNDAAV